MGKSRHLILICSLRKHTRFGYQGNGRKHQVPPESITVIWKCNLWNKGGTLQMENGRTGDGHQPCNPHDRHASPSCVRSLGRGCGRGRPCMGADHSFHITGNFKSPTLPAKTSCRPPGEDSHVKAESKSCHAMISGECRARRVDRPADIPSWHPILNLSKRSSSAQAWPGWPARCDSTRRAGVS